MIPEHDFLMTSILPATVIANIQRIVVNIQLMELLKTVESFPKLGQGFNNYSKTMGIPAGPCT